MKRILTAVIGLVLVLSLLSGCMGYKDTIAEQDQKIEILKQDLSDLQSKVETLEGDKASLNVTLEELEARPTCTPYVELTHLGITPEHLCATLRQHQSLMQEYEQGDRIREMPQIRMEICEAISGDDITIYAYLYYDIILSFHVGSDGYVNQIALVGAYGADAEEDMIDSMTIMTCLVTGIIQGVYGYDEGGDIANKIMGSQGTGVKVVSGNKVNDFSIDPSIKLLKFIVKCDIDNADTVGS